VSTIPSQKIVASAQVAHLTADGVVTHEKIGEVLERSGFISAESKEEILRFQSENNINFGEAAIALGLVTMAQITRALAHQYQYDYSDAPSSPYSEELYAIRDPFGEGSEVIRTLRSAIDVKWKAKSSSCIALTVLSPDPMDGRSMLAANLAISFAQLGRKTLLIGGDMRKPTLEKYFGSNASGGLASYLAGLSELKYLKCDGIRGLRVLPSGNPPPNPQELISSSRWLQALDEWTRSNEVVIVDTPPATQYADALVLTAHVGACILLSKDGETQAKKLRTIADDVRRAGGSVLGGVLR
jgi:protein-tyrosine kinase